MNGSAPNPISPKAQRGHDPSRDAVWVAVVNDDPAQLILLGGLLRSVGLVTRPFSSVEAALCAFQIEPIPSLVITDLHMPDIDGWRFCRLLRSREYAALNRTPILVISATFVGDDVRSLCAASGASAFLPSPVSSETFLRQVRALLSGETEFVATRLLAVDDSLTFLRMLEKGLQSHGYRVCAAADGRTALRLFEEVSPDVVVVDYHLWDIEGDRLLRVFRQRNPSPVIVMITADPDPALAVKWLKAGASAYVRKPFEVDYLAILCTNLLRERDLLNIEHTLAERTRELRESEQRFRDISGAVGEFIWEIDARGVVTYLNDRVSNILGFAPEEIVGRTPLEFFIPGESLAGWPVLESILKERKPFSRLDQKALHRDGDVVWLNISGLPMWTPTGKFRGFRGAAMDVSERKHAEEERAFLEGQIRQAQKMESVGRLAGGVAHDFNNMLSVILGHADLALAELDPASPAGRDLREIQAAAARSAELTRQLLAFARKQPINPRALDLNQAVEGMWNMLQRLLEENISLDWKPGPGLWEILVDPSQLDQVLANLAVNARDAIPETGVITIETANLTLPEPAGGHWPGRPAGEYVVLTVADTGVGMSPETREQIFEPFFTTKAAGRGTGLGLSTVYGIVRQNQGEIRVESTLGKGSTFRLLFPRFLNTAQAGQRTAPEKAPFASGHETILLVEDEAGILKLGTRILEKRGYNVLPARSPLKALDLARRQAGRIDLLVTDVVMPEMDGCRLERALRDVAPTLKSLFMSGYTSDIVGRHGVLADGVNFLQKPFTAEALAESVRRVLDGKAPGWSASSDGI